VHSGRQVGRERPASLKGSAVIGSGIADNDRRGAYVQRDDCVGLEPIAGHDEVATWGEFA